MMVDVLASGVDVFNHAVTSASAMVPMDISGSASGTTWNWSWTPNSTLQEWCRKGAFIIGVLWVVYVLAQFAIPKKGGGGRNIKPVSLILVLFLIIILCNLTLIPTIINFAGKVLYMIGESFGLIKK